MCLACFGTARSRRSLLGTALVAGGAAVAAHVTAGGAQAQTGAPAAAASARITPREALDRLVAGNQRYVDDQRRVNDFSATRAARAEAQSPFAAILGCADSRLAPELLFDQGLGDLFVVRVAGNFVNDDGLGSLEFGAAVLGTKVILVLGHTSCGAVDATVQALRSSNSLPGSIANLVNALKPGIEPVLQRSGPDLTTRALEANVRHSMARLQASPVLQRLIQDGTLAVAGGIYELSTGKVRML